VNGAGAGTASVWAGFGALAAAGTSAATDFAAVYTWRTWTLGWLVRVVSQAVLYGLLGRLLGSAAHQRELFVGGAVLVCATEALLVCASTVNERRGGTFPLIVVTPRSPFVVLLGRGAQWLPGGVVTSLVCLLVVGPAFGVHWTLPAVAMAVPLVVLTAASTYCLGMALGAVVLARPELRNVTSGVAASTLAILGGVAVPLQTWPAPARLLGRCLPLTHTLAAVRVVIDGGPAVTVASEAGIAALAGAGWLAAAWLVVRRVVAAGLRNGSVESGGSA
jgi:ABC-2 type transport system permease protein